VSELHAILQAASIPPPYLLVGHSIGGTYMELYARMYPHEVAGIVLVDARHPEFDRRCEEEGPSSCKFPALLAALLPPAAKRELEASSATMQQVNDSPSFPKVPLFVLTGTNKPLEKAQFKKVWLETQNDLATLSPISKHVVCDRCGHYIQRDDSAAVIDAIQWVIRKTAIK
jgi:pimeloyl-ACP methyl ester carboxylesterase